MVMSMVVVGSEVGGGDRIGGEDRRRRRRRRRRRILDAERQHECKAAQGCHQASSTGYGAYYFEKKVTSQSCL